MEHFEKSRASLILHIKKKLLSSSFLTTPWHPFQCLTILVFFFF